MPLCRVALALGFPPAELVTSLAARPRDGRLMTRALELAAGVVVSPKRMPFESGHSHTARHVGKLPWVRTNSEAGGGDAAIAVMISRHADDPPTAIAWAERIRDPADRLRTIVRLARAWHRSDPEATERWLEENEPSLQVRSAILNPPTAGRRSGERDGPAAEDTRPGPAS